MNRRLSPLNMLIIIRTISQWWLIICVILIIAQVVLTGIMCKTPCLLVLHLPSLVHVDLATVLQWWFLGTTTLVKLRHLDWWAILMVSIISVYGGCTGPLLFQALILLLPLNRWNILMCRLILRYSRLIIIIWIRTRHLIIIILKAIFCIVVVITD